MSYYPASPTTATATLQNGASAPGNGSTITVLGLSSAIITVIGTNTGLSIVVEGSEDGTTYGALRATAAGTSSVYDGSTTISAAGLYQVSTAGLQTVRARIVAIASGSVTVTAHAIAQAYTAHTTDVQGSVAAGVADSGNPVKIGGKYNFAAPSLTDGQRGDAQLDINGNIKTREQYASLAEDNSNGVIAILQRPVASSIYSPSSYKDAGTVTKAVVKATPGNVYAVRVVNTNAAVRYFQLHNKATAPVAGETAQQFFTIPAGTATAPAILELTSSFFAPSENFTTGIGWAISTTATTFTDSATAGEHIVNIRYV